MLEPSDLPRELGGLTLAYRAELERLGAWDQGMMRRRAVERLTSELGSWSGAPVFAYGFEDLTGAEWRLLEALAARSEVHVSLPYEPGRAVFESLSRTATDLAALARGDLVELPARSGAYLPAALARVERNVFEDRPAEGGLDGSIRFLEGAGRRATLELVAESVLDLVRGGTAPEEIAIVCPTLERTRASLETAFGSLGIPVAVESRQRLGGTAFGQALLSLLRFSWAAGTRRELFSFLRTPYSGLPRTDVDYLEGRLRGRAVLRGERTVEETTKLRTGRPLPMLELLAAHEEPLEAARAAVQAMLRNAYGLGAPPVSAVARRDLRAADAAGGVIDELERLRESGTTIHAEELLAALDRATVRGDAAGRARPGGRPRPRPRPHAAVRRRLRDRARAGDAAATRGHVSVLRRRGATRPGRCAGRPTPAARRGEPRPLPVLHRLHPPEEAARARTRGRHGRRLPPRGKPVLGGGLRALRAGRRAPAHDAAAARPADVADRGGADRARAAPLPCPPGRRRPTRGRRARIRQRLAAQAPPGETRVLAADRNRASPSTSPARESRDVPGHRSRAHGGLLGGLVRRALSPSWRDRPGDRPPHARLHRARGAAALLQPAARRDPRGRAGDAGERRGGGAS